jgi:uncharacterized OB-fold protein
MPPTEILLDVFTRQAMDLYGHAGSAEFYRRLAQDRTLCGTRCERCNAVALPPRAFCPDCFHPQVQWVDVGDRATLYAFTTQSRALRFMAPAVIGVVEIVDVGLFVAPIAGRLGDLEIGDALTLDVMDLDAGFSVARYAKVDP